VPVFHEASQNLYRLESSEIYYAPFERGGKQILRACLKTQSGEGERPREPEYHWEEREVRARGDARPPKRPFLKQALSLSL